MDGDGVVRATEAQTSPSKARAGQVTGGRVFGYDNHTVNTATGERAHVVRRINDAEAVVVRQIFEMSAEGFGLRRIAIALNDKGAVSPRSQRSRPTGWAPSSVREVLHRELYRGEIVWNKTHKRDQWGRHKQAARPEAEWIHTSAPELEIVSAALWRRAHAHLDTARRAYDRSTVSTPGGRPISGVVSKYLLTGLTKCAECGGSMLVRSGTHGLRRAYRYACSSYHLRGRSVCANHLEISMADADAAVIDAGRDVLSRDIVDEAVRLAVAALTTPAEGQRADRNIRVELEAVEAELRRLVGAIAGGASDLGTITAAIREREARAGRLRAELKAATAKPKSWSAADRRRYQAELRGRLNDWRRLMAGNVAEARQVLRLLLTDKVVCRPLREKRTPRYALDGAFSLGGLFQWEEGCPKAMASPPGFEPGFWP
jgi:site-specific DNA recombinase